MTAHTSNLNPVSIETEPASDVFAAHLALVKPTEGPARKRKRGARHAGVVLLKPNPARRIWWRLRYADPDSGRTVTETLPRTLTTAAMRDDAAVRKAKALDRRRVELSAGALPTTGTSLADAVALYFRDHPQQKAPGGVGYSKHTLTIYRGAARRFLTWAASAGLRSADDVNGPALIRFRAAMIQVPKRRAVKGGALGQKVDTTEGRAPISINQDLRTVGTILTYLRRLGLVPRLTADALAESLDKLKLPKKRIGFCSVDDLRAILDATLAHDRAQYSTTRKANEARARRGTARAMLSRFQPAIPFIATAILTGMRLGELLSLTWECVDLDAQKIHLDAAFVKTRSARSIDLSVCPALAALLASVRPKNARGSVFGINRPMAYEMLKRLRTYGAPKLTPNALRRTAGTFMTNAPGIFGTASAWCSARQLGHSVQIAERIYVGVVKVEASARTLEAAMALDTHPALLAAGDA